MLTCASIFVVVVVVCGCLCLFLLVRDSLIKCYAAINRLKDSQADLDRSIQVHPDHEGYQQRSVIYIKLVRCDIVSMSERGKAVCVTFL